MSSKRVDPSTTVLTDAQYNAHTPARTKNVSADLRSSVQRPRKRAASLSARGTAQCKQEGGGGSKRRRKTTEERGSVFGPVDKRFNHRLHGNAKYVVMCSGHRAGV